MALLTKKGSFSAPTATGNQAISGLGFQPKALILWATPQTAEGFGANASWAMGLIAGATQRKCVAAIIDDAITPTTTAHAARRVADLAISILSASGGVVGGTVGAEADFVSFNSGGFTLNWTTAAVGKNYIVHYLALGGSDITGAFVGSFGAPAGTGNQSTSGVGFKPDCVIGASMNASTNGTGFASNIFAFTAPTVRGSAAVRSQDAVSPTSAFSYERTDRAVVALTTTAETVNREAELVSMDADGFTLNFVVNTGSAGAAIYPFLALKGGRYAVVADTQKTSTGTKAKTGVGFQPAGLFMFGTNRAASSATDNTQAKFSIGGTDGTTVGCTWCSDNDNATTTVAKSSTVTTKVLRHATNASTVDAECGVSTLDSDGYTLNWTTADATAREFIVVAFGSSVADPAQSTVVAGPTSVVANGVSSATVTVTLRDANGVPLQGRTVSLAKSGGSSVISPASAVTDANGVAAFTVTDTVVEGPITYTATDTTESVTITQTAQVTFTAVLASAAIANKVSRAVWKVEVAWDQYVQGFFTFDTSTFDGTDVLQWSPWGSTFAGVYDDITAPADGSRVDRITITRGREDDLTPIRAGECTLEISDPNGKFSRKNAASPLAGKLVPNRPLRVSAVASGVMQNQLVVSGNEITDAVRAAKVQGDGRTAEGSFGIWEATVNEWKAGSSETILGFTGYQGATITRSQEQAKFGAWSMKVVTPGVTVGGGGEGTAAFSTYNVVAAPGDIWTCSFWLYDSVGGHTLFTGVEWADAALVYLGGTYGANFVTVQGWQRIVLTSGAAPAGTAFAHPLVIRTAGTPQAITIYIDGIQLEHKAFATPYVHTDGAAGTRPAARVQALGSLLNGTQGALVMRIRPGWGSASPPGPITMLFDWRASVNDLITGFYDQASSRFILGRFANGVGTYLTAPATAFNPGDSLTIVFAWTATQLKISINGAAFTTVTDANLPVPNSMIDLGSLLGTYNNHLNGDLLWAATALGTLTDADAATLHALGDTGPPTLPIGELSAGANVSGLLPMATVRYQINMPSQRFNRFYGWIQSIEWEPKGRRGVATIHALDFFSRLDPPGDDQSVKPTITPTGPTTTGAAIGKILDFIEWRDPTMRSLADGDIIPNFTLDGTVKALQAVEDLLLAERGMFYIAPNGVITYRSRNQRQIAPAVALIENVMDNMASGVDIQRVIDKWTVTRTGGVPQTAGPDAFSKRQYGLIDSAIGPTPYLPSDTAASDLANYLFSRTKDPDTPLWELALRNKDDATLVTILSRDLGERVTLSEAVTPSSSDHFIEQIREEISDGGLNHSCTWRLSQRPAGTPFMFDQSVMDGADLITY